jgi:hypothetical protein
MANVLSFSSQLNGTAVPVDQPDFRVDNQGTIVLLFADSDAAKQWVTDNLPGDALEFGGATVVEHRYIEDILFGIHNDGLTFEVR